MRSVTVNTPTAGTWYIMLRGYSDYSGASLKATYGDVYTLQNGVPVNGLSAPLGNEKYYKIEVPSGQDTLQFTTSGGTGNVDVYIKRGAKPTTASWDHRLIQPGNAESINISSPAGGTWYVMLKAQQAYNGVTLKARVFLHRHGDPAEQRRARDEYLRHRRQRAHLSFDRAQRPGQARVSRSPAAPATPTSTSNAARRRPRWSIDYRPYLIGSEETVTVNNPTGGDWFVMIRGYRAYAGLTLVATFGGGTPEPDEVTILLNGVAVTGISGAAEGMKFFKIDVPAGQAKLEILMSGGTGDADLYVRKGAKPTTTEWDYRPYLIGNNEMVTIDTPEAATWYIMLRGYAAFSWRDTQGDVLPRARDGDASDKRRARARAQRGDRQ